MSDNLRDRVTRVLNRELLAQLPDALSSGDDLAPSPSGTINLQHLADAVIRELGMHREEMSEWAVLSEGFRGHRYVTHWEENDPSPVTKIRSAEKLGLTGDGE